MKKSILTVLFVLSMIGLKAQFGYSLIMNNSNYLKLGNDYAFSNSSFSSELEVFYFFNNRGISTGAYFNDRFFVDKNDTIKSHYVQFPLMFSTKSRIKGSPIGFTNSIGYILTLPYKTLSKQNSFYDIGIIHGVIFNITIDFWIQEHVKIFTGFSGSYDLYNRNNIKYTQYGSVLGLSVCF